ncbi:hypothetical protein JCM33374_g2834 [Metschnikowia sp. JCM 33374]|nr:hypothetical protein JCM33374_g2834 [Metschnikowia sp. JCM 33374]
MSTRRKSTINLSRAIRQDRERDESAALELERLEQETTLVLQEIDHNLSHANAVINDKMFPVLKKYAAATSKVWENVGFWKNFMEEAADVEVKTSIEEFEPQTTPKLTGRSEIPTSSGTEDAETNVGIASNTSSDSLEEIQASTPQQSRSRTSIMSAHAENSPRGASRRPAAVHQRVPSSSNKNTPLRLQSESEARRSSLILKHLNSSPTLPEPPVLMSEIGKFNTGTGSSAVKPSTGISSHITKGLSSSDSDNSDLGKLSPVLLPSLTLTPIGSKPTFSQEKSTQRFPNTPVFGSSTSRKKSDRNSIASPVQRGHGYIPEPVPDVPEIPMPKSVIVPALVEDDSDEIAVPQLLSLRVMGGKRDRHEEETNVQKKRKIPNDDDNNVFLDHNSTSRNNSTIYHTMAHESAIDEGNMVESNSKSMSDIFDRVLLAGPSEQSPPSHGEKQTHKKSQGLMGAPETEQSEPSTSPKEGSSNKKDGAEIDSPRPDLTGNMSQVAHSFENTANSSDMDSFFREKYKSLTRNLRN